MEINSTLKTDGVVSMPKPTGDSDDNGWGEYGKFVLAELRRLATAQEEQNKLIAIVNRDNDNKVEDLRVHFDACITEMRKEIAAIIVDSAVSRTKIAVIVGIGSLIGGAVVSLIIMLVEHTL